MRSLEDAVLEADVLAPRQRCQHPMCPIRDAAEPRMGLGLGPAASLLGMARLRAGLAQLAAFLARLGAVVGCRPAELGSARGTSALACRRLGSGRAPSLGSAASLRLCLGSAAVALRRPFLIGDARGVSRVSAPISCASADRISLLVSTEAQLRLASPRSQPSGGVKGF